MKEVLYTIPLNDAVNAGGECPFCNIEKDVEQDLLDFVLGSGSSYMEADVRAETDEEGFCAPHLKKMFAYGNTLGNGWILKTHYMKINAGMHKAFEKFSPAGNKGLFGRSKGTNGVVDWIRDREESCYICKRYAATYKRYLATFIHMYRNDGEFRQKIFEGKGFCLTHFADLLEYADETLTDKEREEFYPKMFELMDKNMKRMSEDIAWLVEKFDYRNKDADWKDSKDAIQRGMQKLKGGIYD